jgi:hypothetical protein
MVDITPTKIPAALPQPQRSVTSGAPEGQKTEKNGEPVKDSPEPEKTAGDLARAGASPQPATGAADTPKTDIEKKAYVKGIVERAAREYGVPESQVIFDLSKFKDKDDPTKEVGANSLDDPRLAGRWLNKVYGEAKKLEGVLDGKGPF